MSTALEMKKAVVSEVVDNISSAQAAVIAEYRGLTVAQLTELRKDAHSSGVYLKVIKNTLAKLAIKDTDFACLNEHLVGPVIFSASDDPVAVAKVMAKFAKDNEALKITSGAMGGDVMDISAIQALSKLPGREELLATLVATMQAPIVKLVRTMNEVPTKAVRALSAVRDSKEAA
ncbi:MAG: 50S ribosomal protein L10 [Arenicellales bacterium]